MRPDMRREEHGGEDGERGASVQFAQFFNSAGM